MVVVLVDALDCSEEEKEESRVININTSFFFKSLGLWAM
jgi:hypothetical protein